VSYTGVVAFGGLANEPRDDVPADIVEKTAELRHLLKLPAEAQRFVLTYSPPRPLQCGLEKNKVVV
jgi:hypothetical protein